ncbi:DUF3613 domain-containing protein [Pseudomonas sp. K1(2024)]|uniref:DUF3613 domain-containing protein n=2 Tax=Pseudomonas TaxID=286 RepID=A0AAI8P9V2_9PSED|nr:MULTISPECIES: DUF3613 domain-containing protein [Pseudomonas]AXO86954.1 DUF3613 domain-containing protein [Pseudomonas parafulva]MDO7904274.1 DUF3613 domain-containing protein [Pseudomonas sp. K13]
MIRYLVLLIGSVGLGVVLAQERPPAPATETAAEAWLRVQASGTQASPRGQAQTAQERERALQRWLDSYKHPIPQYLRRPSAKTADN